MLTRRHLLAAAGTALAAPAAQAQRAQVLRFVPHANLTSLDPVWTTAWITRYHGYAVYDTLYSIGADLVPKPQMCAGHRVEDDGRRWVFTLRDGLRFHDDTPVLARDCVASIRRWARRDSFGSTMMQSVAEIAALDDRRFEIRLTKPFPLLIDAMAKLKQQGHEDVVAVLAGDPQGRDNYVRQLDQRISQHGLEGSVLRVGHCSDMPAAFMAASVVTVPSIEPEAFGRSAVEAQAMGTPVIVSELGAVPETVLAPPEVPARERSGWRIPPNDPEALANALTEALILGASGRDALANRARKHVEKYFSLDRMVGDTLAIYAELFGA